MSDDDDDVLHAAGVILATEALAISLEDTMREVVLPFLEARLSRIAIQVAALDDRVNRLEQT